MAFQFVHLEAYSRKADKGGRTTSFVFDEAERKPHACVHVENPEPPTVVHGYLISDLRMMHDRAVADARTVNKDGRQRAVRIDQKTLLTVVASHPYTVAECRADAAKMAEYEAWERDTVQWLCDQYGDDLKTVVRHCDESHMHIHAYVLPSHLKALDLHPGVNAKRRQKAAALEQGEDAKSANKMGDAAYKESMRAWQDSYYDRVAVRHGLARLGPKLRRLSREEWQREKAAAQALKRTVERAAIIQQQGNAYIRDIKKKAAELAAISKAKSDVATAQLKKTNAAIEQAGKVTAKANLLNERAQKTHADAQKIIEKAQSEASRILSAARNQAQNLTSIGAGLRAFFAGFRINRIRAEAEAAVQELVRLAEAKASHALDKYFSEMKRRKDAEARVANAVAAARECGVELREAREQIASLTYEPSKTEDEYMPKRR
ncbi:hypothetical protein [Brucella intermedia]|uniref:hypothetical protein n=1 Tax=Brucella intermedia TaxID=94625 RepID=UPI00124C25F4|nr:hypothetical protein [Brucella intermedia]KAB2733594.1 ATP synthase F0 subunit B [Brucella intermedia]